MKADNDSTHDSLGPALALLTLRLWLGLRALVTGIEKWAGNRTVEEPLLDEFGEPDMFGTMVEVKEKVYGLSHYHGVPPSLMERLRDEPLMPGFALTIYDWLLGPLLLVLGFTLLLGLFVRSSLFAVGLIYASLTVGLILLGQDGGIAWLGVHIALVALALTLARYHRFYLGRRWGHL